MALTSKQFCPGRDLPEADVALEPIRCTAPNIEDTVAGPYRYLFRT